MTSFFLWTIFINIYFIKLLRFGIEKEVRVCDSCYAQLQAGRTPRGEQSAQNSKKVTWADDQDWQDEQAAVLAKYAEQAKQKQRNQNDQSQRNNEEVWKIIISNRANKAELQDICEIFDKKSSFHVKICKLTINENSHQNNFAIQNLRDSAKNE